MPAIPMRGVYPILVTPFHEDGAIDEESLRRLIDFDLNAGVHGLGVALGSEVFKLTEAERDRVTRIVVDQVAGRVPVVINSGAAGTDLAVHYSKAAQDNGADALMIMPPTFMPATSDEVLDYFRAISNAVSIPIFLQDTPSAVIGPGLARQLAEECEWVQYIKVESQPITAKVAGMVDAAGDVLTVFGGAGGGYFIEEMRRGSVGTMPFCSQPEAFVAVWNAFQAGDETTARAVFDATIMPINRVAAQGSGIFYTVHKELLRRRGVLRTNKVRSPAPSVEPKTMIELEMLVQELYPE
ncbi:MAG: dihydrodipicolinate synthase family protein [Caldilineaceae bacterium]|nr:dihydrodipicolinate synthase family protein [Caldilineaceae bacterium]